MRLWRVMVLMAVTLAVGVSLGYVLWGRAARELREVKARPPQTGPRPVPDAGRWTARGVVRIILREQSVVFLTHEPIPGLMAESTRAFTAANARLLGDLSPGDRVRFVVERRGPRIVLVSIEREAGQGS